MLIKRIPYQSPLHAQFDEVLAEILDLGDNTFSSFMSNLTDAMLSNDGT